MSKKDVPEKTIDEVSMEIYETKVRDLTEKLQRYKDKCDTLLAENDALTKSQTKFSHDKQDIVEFLNIKVHEHEEHINTLEARCVELEEAQRETEAKGKMDLEAAVAASQAELEQTQLQLARYKAELDQLHDFRGKKDELEISLKRYLTLLETKEREYKDAIHSMERKVLQDKNQMKKEMLQKVNEAVANFRRVADQQMAETTKRAIRENMAITSQLKKMSAKTLDLLAENEALSEKVVKLQTSNSLLASSERELAKKNQANQRVIKMLVERLKESDEMLEVAYDANQSNDVSQSRDSDNFNESEEDIFATSNRSPSFRKEKPTSNDTLDSSKESPGISSSDVHNPNNASNKLSIQRNPEFLVTQKVRGELEELRKKNLALLKRLEGVEGVARELIKAAGVAGGEEIEGDEAVQAPDGHDGINLSTLRTALLKLLPRSKSPKIAHRRLWKDDLGEGAARDKPIKQQPRKLADMASVFVATRNGDALFDDQVATLVVDQRSPRREVRETVASTLLSEVRPWGAPAKKSSVFPTIRK